MLKMYHRDDLEEGGSPAYWEAAWNDGGFDEALRFCEVDPLRSIFESYTQPGTVMLEGGCGRGQYVAYYSNRGIQVVGLDFARDALTHLHDRYQNLPLCAGDVANLPFKDEAFDVYYSGGVVEHFESGTKPALDEAWRVLRPGGILLISVPYLSPLRQTISRIKTSAARHVADAAIDKPEERQERRFFQYAYTRSEFKRLLAQSGFEVLSTRGYSLLWGLYDLPLLNQVVDRARKRMAANGAVAQSPQPGAATAPQAPHSSSRAIIKRLVINEDDTVPVAGKLVSALRWACANMMMYVCVRGSREQRLHRG